MEIYRAIKTVKKYGFVLCEGIVYIKKDGRQIVDSENDMVVLPRQNFNKKGTFYEVFKAGKDYITKEYKVLEKVN